MNCTRCDQGFRSRLQDAEFDHIDLWQSLKESEDRCFGIGQCLLGKKRFSFIPRAVAIPGMNVPRSPPNF